MAKADAVAAGIAAIAQGQSDAFGSCYDVGFKDGGSGVAGTFSQSDIDAAVKVATDADQAHMQDLQGKVDLEASQLVAFKATVTAALQAALAQLNPPAPVASN